MTLASLPSVLHHYCHQHPNGEHYNITIDKSNGYVYLDPKGEHDRTIIFMHGHGGTAHGMMGLFTPGDVAPLTARIVLP